MNEPQLCPLMGVGAYDLISRNSMMEGLLRMETYLWEDEVGISQDIAQGEGGEQGDPLMPLRFALGLHAALSAVQDRFRADEKVFAFLDDVYVTCAPERVWEVHRILEEEIFAHTQIKMHYGKTQVWNRGQVTPRGVEALTRAAQQVKRGAIVWRGDTRLPEAQQGVKILGIPVGQPGFVMAFLEQKSQEHALLFERIPAVDDPQSAWLILVMCAATRANFWLRGVQPDLTESFAETHDARVWECLRQILKIPDRGHSRAIASLPFPQGGLGLVSASRVRSGAHWASWADCLRMVRQRHPSVADTMIRGLDDGAEPCFVAVRTCAQTLSLAEREEVVFAEEPEPHEPKIGLQQQAVKSLHRKFHQESFWPALTNSAKALMHSQHGPLASAPFTAVPTTRMTRLEAQIFRVCFCRRLHLPLPLSSRTCRCGRELDSFGHHRAACAEAGVLSKRGFPLECAAAQVCREAGARVTTNSFIRDLDLGEFNGLDGRRIEVIADGLTLWQGAQLAIDTTLVSPLHRDGSARRGAASRPGLALEQARRRKEATYPELVGDDGRARLVVLAAETGGRWSNETAQFLRGLAKGKAETAPLLLQNRVLSAWLARWSCILACSSTRAFAQSLLERRPNPGTGVDIPSEQEVIRDARFG